MHAPGSARVLTTAALLAACAAVLGFAESALLPALPVPGVKLGLANAAVLAAVALLGPRPGLAVAAAKVLLVGLAAGTLGGPATLMSVAGTLAAWVAMSVLAKAGDRFSLVGLSVGGSAAHMIAQLAAACALSASAAPLMLAPLALAACLPAGLVVGFLVRSVLSRLPLTAASPAAA